MEGRVPGGRELHRESLEGGSLGFSVLVRDAGKETMRAVYLAVLPGV